MAEFPAKVSTRTSSPAQGAGASVSALRPDLGFVRSSLGALMLLQLVRARGAAGRVGGPGQAGGIRDSGAVLLLRSPKTPNPGSHAPRRAAATPGRLRHGRPPPRSPGNPFSSRRPSCRPCEHTPGALTFGAPPLQRPLIPARWSPAATITARDSLSVSVGLSLFARTLSPALQGTKPPAPSGSAWLHPRTLSV